MNTIQNNNLILVTGYSGAGMSSVLKNLEDLGLEVFDNFPLPLVSPLVHDEQKEPTSIAIGIDTRTRGFSTQNVIDTAQALDAHLLFVTCDDHELQRRFIETRRRHPLAKDKSVRAGIEEERKLLEKIQYNADLVIDTTTLSVHDLRHILEGHFSIQPQKDLTVTLMSFGFKHGSPREADIIMDVRFLENPHWVEALRPLTGKDKDVGDHIEKDPNYAKFIDNFKALMTPLLPRYAHEGKKYLTIAIGCTGGRHRSVYTVEKLSQWIKETGSLTHIEHRDIKD
ncbi:MAG: RNase adapter RapZ [Micavibrio sp.]|nr:RNase adapter RapZ [Micavibrio sp.]|tara:strand:+ start:255 stop:1103 length:849 start_codon:yes stop_codon:yes gene_type:complete